MTSYCTWQKGEMSIGVQELTFSNLMTL